MNPRTLIAGDSSSPVILHVPHASRTIPGEVRSSLTVTDAQLTAELDEITDAYTDVIAQHAARSTGVPPWILRNDLSRLVIDPERFPDDREELNAVGRGAVYTRTCNGAVLRNEDDDARTALLDTYFHPYAAAMSDLVTDRIAATGRAVIIDVHSYPTLPSAYELHTDGPRPTLCIGTDPHHTPQWLTDAAHAAFYPLTDIGRNTPFGGTYVPLDHYRTDPLVYSVMIELRRDQYLTENGELVDIAAEKLGAMLGRLVDAADRGRR
ncbi:MULTISPECIES: N-formylglutamate amidohydrolase [Rhodococcus]|uniref:N-formylglutamate amidohydrolase n=1 Tax=Rhodococcus qingshengii JCM 15477 TaxID=1303681 RepID=A0AB38RPG2_RHOSG|nr:MULTISPECIES: N-formylglutamate amidohydrolase [Rhodococcus]MDA3637522.1 N-formylglutamate amidohydrolase [Rhodococcus sp. C-2]UPU46664.1 N-formylglutamate amidohydrolase [Rhodococcus qingshengii JCM 15477]